jgi:hypothetical protein
MAYMGNSDPITVTVQKNLDHFNGNMTEPGWFEINVSADGGATFEYVRGSVCLCVCAGMP